MAQQAEQTSFDAPMRRCLLVLGMHRSGTSACARLLGLLGADLPKTMSHANAANKAGYWEPVPLFQANDKILSEAGSVWYDWRTLDLALLPASRRAEINAELSRIIVSQYPHASLLVLKDPRICRMADLYGGLIKQLGIAPYCVMPIRNPLAVMASLNARDGISEAYTGLLWLRHVLDAEVETRAWPRTIVSYDELLRDWRPSVNRMSAQLHLDWPRSAENAASDITGFLTTTLRNHDPSQNELAARADVAEWIKAAYDALLRLIDNPYCETATAALDKIRAQFDPASDAFGRAMFSEMAALEGRHHSASQTLRDDIEDARAAFAFRDAELREAKRHIAELIAKAS